MFINAKKSWLKIPGPPDADAGGAGGSSDAPPAVGAAETAPAADPPLQVTTRGGSVIPMNQVSIDKLKRDERERGKRIAASEMESRAKALGYGSADEMFAAAEQARKRNVAKSNQQQRPQQRPANQKPNARQPEQNQRRGQGADDRRSREMQDRLDRERRDRIRAQRKADQSQRDAWAAEAIGELKVLALKSGIKDPDYAIHLWQQEAARQKTNLEPAAYDKWLNDLNESEFFTGLQATRPYLFQEVVVPANSGITTTGDKSPPPPGAGTVTKSQVASTAKDGRKMTREEYHADLRRRGLTPPSV